MIEAMWGVEFTTNLGKGFGVVVLQGGKILGGDSSFVYLGTYEFTDGIFIANVDATNDHDTLDSVFGDIDEFSLTGKALIGNELIKEFIVNGAVVGRPDKTIMVKFTRRAEL